MRSRIVLGILFGAIGGFIGYLLQEWRIPHDPVLAMPAGFAMLLGALVGAMLGIGIGAIEGAAIGSPQVLLRGVTLGAVIGAVGGMFGMYFGGQVYNLALMGRDPVQLSLSHNILDFLHLVIARALAWTFLGAFPGLAAGASTLSLKRANHGLLGGIIGGFIGGLVFDLVAVLISGPVQGMAGAASGQRLIETGALSRAIGFTTIGIASGLFIGLVEELMKQAWVRVLAGRNEGKDYIISKPLTVLGRDERADIPLYGDPALASQHAAIKMANGRHVLVDGGTSVGSVVNGQTVTEQLLRDGDMIQLGQVRLLFREKATATKVGRPAVDAPKQSAQTPGALAMPSHLCPFCGAQKDASGNCLCTVPGSAPMEAPPPPAAAAWAPQPAPLAPGAGVAPQPTAYGGLPAFGAQGGIGSQIQALEGPYAGQAFMLSAGNNTIGRDPGNTIPLVNDTTVSRRHAHIADENGQHVVYDDGSSNGTYVNSVRVSVQPLARGDVVQFGSSKFRYE